MNKKTIKYPIILGSIALVAGLILALVYNITYPVIEKNKNKRENAIVLEMFGEDVKIRDLSNTLNENDKNNGLTSVLEVKNDKVYYVYKITIEDAFDGDASSFVLAFDNEGKISKLKFISTGDSYAGLYSKDNYFNRIKGKEELNDNDKISGASKTGETIIEAINAASDHNGRDE